VINNFVGETPVEIRIVTFSFFGVTGIRIQGFMLARQAVTS
jgi:hypothetical protein